MTVRGHPEDEMVTLVRDFMRRLDDTKREDLDGSTRLLLLELHRKLSTFLGEGR